MNPQGQRKRRKDIVIRQKTLQIIQGCPKLMRLEVKPLPGTVRQPPGIVRLRPQGVPIRLQPKRRPPGIVRLRPQGVQVRQLRKQQRRQILPYQPPEVQVRQLRKQQKQLEAPMLRVHLQNSQNPGRMVRPGQERMKIQTIVNTSPGWQRSL